jgi:hypothetical protein
MTNFVAMLLLRCFADQRLLIPKTKHNPCHTMITFSLSLKTSTARLNPFTLEKMKYFLSLQASTTRLENEIGENEIGENEITIITLGYLA